MSYLIWQIVVCAGIAYVLGLGLGIALLYLMDFLRSRRGTEDFNR